ncbi:MAG: tRNA pseudouridine(55) synthase TruB [Rickettsiales bacterium]|jgi:tRNA pseudouridine55 synthase|nr:tRNA pseudouridine(55) synthase TruB [Rickettsiales bacterium]
MNGWIILDKPSGMTSRAAGGRVMRMFGAETFGHIGTLDPMASGLLPIALGNATKMIPFFESEERRAQSEGSAASRQSAGRKSQVEDVDNNEPSTLCALRSSTSKEYLFSVQFGFETDTLDITGTVVKETNVVPLPAQVMAACAALTGTIYQTPPAYSAVHVGGRRGYELARAGKEFEIPPRPVTIDALELLDAGRKSWQFRVVCAPGTYVRAIARDIAAMCDTVATVDMIRRLRTSGLDIKDAVGLDFLENLFHNGGNFEDYLKPVDFGLGDIPVLNLNDADAGLYKQGGFVEIAAAGEPGLVRVFSNGRFIGIGTFDGNLLKPKRTLN